MEIRNARSTSRDDLLGCRAAMLGLDLSEIESRGGEMFETVKQRCASCDFREVCELDLRRSRLLASRVPRSRHGWILWPGSGFVVRGRR
jgi:hypothetical protein